MTPLLTFTVDRRTTPRVPGAQSQTSSAPLWTSFCLEPWPYHLTCITCFHFKRWMLMSVPRLVRGLNLRGAICLCGRVPHPGRGVDVSNMCFGRPCVQTLQGDGGRLSE